MTTNETKQPMILARAGRGVASLLRSLAGTPAGWQSSRRRGSFLIIVVGTLALLAVLAIIYSSIGSHDVRMTAAVKKQERIETIPDQVKDYLITIIGESTLGTFYDSRRYVAGNIPLSRMTFDYPATNYDARSDQLTPTATNMPFTPTGSVSGFMGSYNFTDQARHPVNIMPFVWAPSTPWLADTEPTYLGDPLDALAGEQDRLYQYRRDWRKISNIAPDGRFVNLANLRPNRHGWNANHKQMAENTNYIYSGDPANFAQGATVRNTDFVSPIVPMDLDVPAHFDSRQIWLFRPARANALRQPGDFNYDLNLFADADGDGMFDSRWQELRELRVTPGGTVQKDYLDIDDSLRVFVAVRIIDASAMINVNTATDQRGAPTALAPLGLTPGDVDLRKLLTGWDARIASETGPDPASFGRGHEWLHQEFPFPAPNTASEYNRDPFNYEVGDDKAGRDLTFTSGIYAYDALRLSILTGVTPQLGLTGADIGTTYEATYSVPHDSWDYTNQPLYKADHYHRTAVSLQGAMREMNLPTGAPASVRMLGGFNADEMFELYARRVVNDPTITSTLELTLGGRADASSAPPNETRFSPLRSNRPLEIERRSFSQFSAVHDDDYARTMRLFELDQRSRLTTISGARELRFAPSTINSGGLRSIDPYELGQSELRVDVRLAMADINNQIADPILSAQAKAAGTYSIFRSYVDALAPRLGFGTPWTSPQLQERATEFYGHRGPEMALRVAAHMAVNFIDCFDRAIPATTGGAQPPEQPTIHTLLARRDLTDDLNALVITTPEGLAVSSWLAGPTFPVPTTSGSIDVRPLELIPPSASNSATERLAASTDPVVAPVVNVYGIEAQPFITQVASFTVYADKHGTSDGESDEANIQGGEHFSNPDLMYRMVAVQLHNPFHVDIKLSHQDPTPGVETPLAVDGSSTDSSYYYLQFGDKQFKLAQLVEAVDPTTGKYSASHPTPPETTAEPITIPAGGTIVVYALTKSPFNILHDIAELQDGSGYLDQDSGSGRLRDLRRTAEQILETNLGGNNIGTNAGQIAGIYWIPEINNVGRLSPTTPSGLFPTVTTLTDPPVTMQLWRTIRVDNVDEAGRTNLTGNDQLVDRLRILAEDYVTDAAGNGFNRFLPGSATTPQQHEIDGSDAADTSKLYMVTFSATVSRPGDPAPAAPPRGSIPAYCLEPKFQDSTAPWNVLDDDGMDTDSLPDSDPQYWSGSSDPNFIGRAESVRAWYSNMTGPAGTELERPIHEHPNELDAPTGATAWMSADSVQRPYDRHRIEVPILDNNLQTTGTVAGNSVTTTTVRPADLLLPLGVGPEEMPLDFSSGTPTLITDLERRWTTLGEALAMSLLYQTNPSPVPEDVSSIFYPVAGSSLDPLFTDRGGLRLDAFPPFIDVNTDTIFDPLVDERIGTQAPLALSILDNFTTSPADFIIADDPADFDRNYRWDTLKRATPGTVNFNTAALNTLRAGFPTLCPPPDTEFVGGAPWWWWSGGELNQRSDIAATIVSYRDKVDQYVHALAQVADMANAPGNAPPNTPAGRQDRLVTFEFNTSTPADPDRDEGRTGGTRIIGIGERAGFRTRGELLAANFLYGNDPANPNLFRGWPGNMTFLGHDVNASGQETPTGIEGLDTLLHRDSTGAIIPNEIPNSYKEQLAVINSVVNSASTRSDYFICWFLVHGYKKSDVESLTDADPMVPTMARRFLMIVDRSKVTRLGEKPNVILFKEVPVDPAPR